MATIYLDYTIHLTDAAQVATLQAAAAIRAWPVNQVRDWAIVPWKVPHNHAVVSAGVGMLLASPLKAAELYGAPIRREGEAFAAPCITSPWFVGTAADATFDPAPDKIEQEGGGFLGLFGFGGDTLYWRGVYAYSPAAIADGGGPGGSGGVSPRRWLDGFEQPDQGEGGLGGGVAFLVARGSSRHPDGYGLAIRGGIDGAKNHATDEHGLGKTVDAWERLYIRIVTLPTAGVAFWRCYNDVSANAGAALQITPTGALAVLDVSQTPAVTTLGQTAALTVGTWYRLDLLFEYGAGANIALWVNGTEAINVTALSGTGLAFTGALHARSEVGAITILAPAAGLGLGLDVDDWMCARRPAVPLTGADWLHGSRMMRVEARTFAASHSGWTGDWRALLQKPGQGSATGAALLTSTTASARLVAEADAEITLNGEPASIGSAALVVSLQSLKTGGAPNGQLGYRVAGGTEVLAPIVQSSIAAGWNHVLYSPTGLAAPLALAPLELVHVKGTTGDLGTVYALAAIVEQLGVWGPEDVKVVAGAPLTVKPHTGIHNSPYPRSVWARAGSPPIAPVVLVGGLYVGTGTAIDLPFRAPVHWLWVRPLAGTSPGAKWWSSMLAAHPDFADRLAPQAMVQAAIDAPVVGAGDQTQATVLRIVGADAASNLAGVTYQFIAFCDPAMRFVLNTALADGHGAVARVTPLARNPNFFPEAGFGQREAYPGASSVIDLWYKGVGHATATVSPLDATERANAIAFARGAVTSQAAAHLAAGGASAPLALWRRDDGSADPGLARVLTLTSYVGDGVGPERAIPLTPASGRYPLFGLVVPHTGPSIYRDPSHLGLTSSLVPTGVNADTGIRGGDRDVIKVGIALNAVGVTYDVFLFPGSDEAGENGWGTNGEFVPVAPTVPVDGPWDPALEDPADYDPDTDGGGAGGGTGGSGDPSGADFEAGCAPASGRIVNQALAYIGITQQVGASTIAAGLTVEAQQALLHYSDIVDEVLRAFPWGFATKYATLVLVAGTRTAPATPDWQYSYRAPADLVFARRLTPAVARQLGRRYDGDPPPVRVGRDTTGGLIYTDQIAPVLEYTYRPPCAAVVGDPIFRAAVAWRLAAAFAPALARDAARLKIALQMYAELIRKAELVNAREQQQDNNGPDAPWIVGR